MTAREVFRLKLRSRTLVLGERTLVMGVLNVTPDSFSDGGKFFTLAKAVEAAFAMEKAGADILDIGAESTRPGSSGISAAEEIGRLLPVLEALGGRLKIPISIDTQKAAVAEVAVGAGAEILNDISGLKSDPRVAEIAAGHKVPLILMHMRGTPETMQNNVHYDSLFSEILQYLKESVGRAEAAGLDPEQIIVDPGIGFGKTVEDNLLIIRNLQEFRVLGKPLLLGTSRKSFIGKILSTEVTERLEGTLASIAIGVLNGAHIIRCHDVLQAKRAITIADAIRLAGT